MRVAQGLRRPVASPTRALIANLRTKLRQQASTGVVVTGQNAPGADPTAGLHGGVLMAVAIPAPLVVSDQGLPRVCVRHGEPADRHKRVLFRSKTPGWTYLLIVLGVIVFAIVAAVMQKRVKAPA